MKYSDNPKTKFIWYLIGPASEWLLKRGISPGWFLLVIFGLLLYYLIYHNRPRNKKLNLKEKYEIFLFILFLVLTIVMQIVLLIRPYHDGPIFGG